MRFVCDAMILSVSGLNSNKLLLGTGVWSYFHFWPTAGILESHLSVCSYDQIVSKRTPPCGHSGEWDLQTRLQMWADKNLDDCGGGGFFGDHVQGENGFPPKKNSRISKLTETSWANEKCEPEPN